MKKYAIIIGENNEELSRKVQEALFAVGFQWCGGQVVANQRDGVISTQGGSMFLQAFTTVGGFISYDIEDTELLHPSYVLAHAAELDGAKKPEEVPPEGYRLVTDEEKEASRKTKAARYYRKWSKK